MKGDKIKRFEEIPWCEQNSFFEIPEATETIIPELQYEDSYYEYIWHSDGTVEIVRVTPAYSASAQYVEVTPYVPKLTK